MNGLIEEAEKMALELIAFNDCRFNMDASRIIQELAERLRLQSEVVEAARKHLNLHNKFHEYVNAKNDFPPEISSKDISKGWADLDRALSKLPTGKE